MRPLFSFYGSKWNTAPHYPRPHPGQLAVEPFAGSAGFSSRLDWPDVLLIERDPAVAAVWRYLFSVTPLEVLALPDIEPGQSVDDIGAPQEARWLIRFWLAKATASPPLSPSSWMKRPRYRRQFWGPAIRQRIAQSLPHLRRWRLIEGDYTEAPDVDAYWFIDPPYCDMGKYYRHGADGIDFAALGEWCRRRRGRVTVCEQLGAGWLPFEHLRTVKATTRNGVAQTSAEAVWIQEAA